MASTDVMMEVLGKLREELHALRGEVEQHDRRFDRQLFALLELIGTVASATGQVITRLEKIEARLEKIEARLPQ